MFKCIFDMLFMVYLVYFICLFAYYLLYLVDMRELEFYVPENASFYLQESSKNTKISQISDKFPFF